MSHAGVGRGLLANEAPDSRDGVPSVERSGIIRAERLSLWLHSVVLTAGGTVWPNPMRSHAASTTPYIMNDRTNVSDTSGVQVA